MATAPGGDRPERIRRLLASGASAACTAAGLGLVVVTMLVLAGWIAAPHFGLGLIGVVRTATVLWLVGHHVTVQVSGAGQIGMLPLGLVALPGTLLWRAGRAIVRGHHVTGLRDAVAVALAVAVPYAALAGALAVASRSSLAAASIPQALLRFVRDRVRGDRARRGQGARAVGAAWRAHVRQDPVACWQAQPGRWRS